LGYAELGEDDRLRCVAVLDNDQLTKTDRTVFFSGEFELRGDVRKPFYVAREAALLGLSLTFSPASLAAQPIKILTGDLRSLVDPRKWSTSWRWSSPLVARALDHLEQYGSGWNIGARSATRIIDRAAESENERARAVLEREQLLVETRQPQPRDLQRVPPQFRPGWKPGDLEWSLSGGRVLRVS
jgi:hypothetical protein